MGKALVNYAQQYGNSSRMKDAMNWTMGFLKEHTVIDWIDRTGGWVSC